MVHHGDNEQNEANFRKYLPSLEHFNKPVKNSKKLNKSKRRRNRDAGIVIHRMEKTKKVERIENPNADHLLSMSYFSDLWYLV